VPCFVPKLGTPGYPDFGVIGKDEWQEWLSGWKLVRGFFSLSFHAELLIAYDTRAWSVVKVRTTWRIYSPDWQA
jgi:hypothetical protein